MLLTQILLHIFRRSAVWIKKEFCLGLIPLLRKYFFFEMQVLHHTHQGNHFDSSKLRRLCCINTFFNNLVVEFSSLVSEDAALYTDTGAVANSMEMVDTPEDVKPGVGHGGECMLICNHNPLYENGGVVIFVLVRFVLLSFWPCKFLTSVKCLVVRASFICRLLYCS